MIELQKKVVQTASVQIEIQIRKDGFFGDCRHNNKKKQSKTKKGGGRGRGGGGGGGEGGVKKKGGRGESLAAVELRSIRLWKQNNLFPRDAIGNAVNPLLCMFVRMVMLLLTCFFPLKKMRKKNKKKTRVTYDLRRSYLFF